MNIATTTTDFRRFYREMLQTPTLQKQLKAAIKNTNNTERFEQNAIALGRDRGYRITPPEIQALVKVESVLQQLYRDAVENSFLRAQLRKTNTPQSLCRLAIQWTKQQGSPLNPAEVLTAIAIGTILEDFELEEEELNYYPQIVSLCIC